MLNSSSSSSSSRRARLALQLELPLQLHWSGQPVRCYSSCVSVHTKRGLLWMQMVPAQQRRHLLQSAPGQPVQTWPAAGGAAMAAASTAVARRSYSDEALQHAALSCLLQLQLGGSSG